MGREVPSRPTPNHPAADLRNTRKALSLECAGVYFNSMNNALKAINSTTCTPADANEFIRAHGIIAALPRHEDVVLLHVVDDRECKVTIHRMKRAGLFQITVEEVQYAEAA